MKTFAEFWATTYALINHNDILRTAELAWNDGWQEGSKQARIEDNGIIHFQSAQIAELRDKTFARFNEEECWIFQDDGEDYPDSLVCPVVISAEQLRDFLEHRERSLKAIDIADRAYAELDVPELAGLGYADKIYNLICDVEL